MTKVSASISRAAFLASFLNEKGAVRPWAVAPKRPPTRCSKTFRKFTSIILPWLANGAKGQSLNHHKYSTDYRNGDIRGRRGGP